MDIIAALLIILIGLTVIQIYLQYHDETMKVLNNVNNTIGNYNNNLNKIFSLLKKEDEKVNVSDVISFNSEGFNQLILTKEGLFSCPKDLLFQTNNKKTEISLQIYDKVIVNHDNIDTR